MLANSFKNKWTKSEVFETSWRVSFAVKPEEFFVLS